MLYPLSYGGDREGFYRTRRRGRGAGRAPVTLAAVAASKLAVGQPDDMPLPEQYCFAVPCGR